MITKHDIRKYIMASDKASGLVDTTPYMLLEMLVNEELSTEDLKTDILYHMSNAPKTPQSTSN